ncbi:hypothetical protein OQX63_23020, partial [Pedobacter sp. PF22-3]|uniref:hypothetical protein n=1 Tax=Pedobacter sp. PF22-3 TaxID=2994467 RepID=UPI0022460DAA
MSVIIMNIGNLQNEYHLILSPYNYIYSCNFILDGISEQIWDRNSILGIKMVMTSPSGGIPGYILALG